MRNDNMQRPLDVLGNSVDKTIIVKTKAGEDVIGVLKAFDSHINVWLDDAKIEGEKEIKIGRVLIRGDNIVYISPGK
ncbi:MAG: RNA-binding protein [Nanoarchaeota archaeon]|nr:RNA-binding protein [Nanoarchaeota archaeon]